MTLFQELIGAQPRAIELETAETSSAPETKGSSGFKGNRVDLAELESVYVLEPMVFRSINIKKQMIMSAGWDIRSDSKRALSAVNEFIRNIRKKGEDMSLEELFDTIYTNLYIYGKHFVEIIYKDMDLKKPIDLFSPDPKTIDFARDMSGNVVLDTMGMPVGYTKVVPMGMGTKGDPSPDKVFLRTGQIFLRPERIAHFKINQFGDRLNSVGEIEPAYKSITRKQAIDEAQATLIFQRGTAPLVDYVGDPSTVPFPTPDMISNSAKNLSKIQHNRYFAVPHYHNIRPIEIPQIDAIPDVLKSLKSDITSSLGMPISLATGAGEETNRSTLGSQLKLMEYGLREVVDKVTDTFRKQIFSKVIKARGFSEKEIPEIVWGDIDTEDKNAKAERLARYASNKTRILDPDDVRPFAIKSEQLDIYDKSDAPKRKFDNEVQKNGS